MAPTNERPGNLRFLNIPEKVTSEEYLAKVQELRALVQDELPKEGCYQDDEWVARFLRAKKCDVPKAKEMLLESLKWRQEHKVDTHFERPPPDEKIVKYLPYAVLDENSKDGHVVYYERSGKLCIPSPDVISQDQLFHWKVDVSERLAKRCRASRAKGGSGVGVAILDMEGLSLAQMNGHTNAMLKMIGETEEKHYPESLYKVVILNANIVFSTVWKVVRFFFSGEVRDKIVICGADYEKTLYQYVEPEILPTSIKGGKSTRYEGASWVGDLAYQQHLAQSAAHEGCDTKQAIKAGAAYEHTVEVERNEKLMWRFTLEKGSIDFTVVSPSGKPLRDAVRFDIGKEKQPMSGELVVEEKGTHTLRFCNKFSWTASKVLRYTCSVVKEGEELVSCP